MKKKNRIEADLCIIGAGVAGLAVASDWFESGKKVVIVESGGFNPETSTQKLNEGYNVGLPYFNLVGTRLRYFGGTSNHWTGLCTTLDPIDFEEKSDIPLSGWPISGNEVYRELSKAKRYLGLKEPLGFSDSKHWKVTDPNSSNDYHQFYKKGFCLSPPIRLNRKLKNLVSQHADQLLVSHANLMSINLTSDYKEVDHIICQSLNGNRLVVEANQFILSLGALQSTRMLLNSNHQLSKGIGNEYGLVGKYFMEHPEVQIGEFMSSPSFDASSFLINRRRRSYFFELATSKELLHEGYINATFSFSRKSDRYWVQMRMEQTPNKDSVVTLASEKDALGIPLLKLNWQLSGHERKALKELPIKLGESMIRSKIGRFKVDSWVTNLSMELPEKLHGGWHHMGTLRMNSVAHKGVVDENCRVHGITNLYINGSAVFPTSGSANPTLTIASMAFRLSQHLKKL